MTRNIFLLILAIGWTAFFIPFQKPRLESLYRQLSSVHYARTTGVVTQSEVVREKARETTPMDKIIYDVRFEYRYAVNGQTFTGSRYRFNNGPKRSGDIDWAQRTVSSYPVGTLVPVFYVQGNPGDSLLAPGLAGQDIALVLVLTPFNCVIVGLWLMVFQAWGWKLFHRKTAGVRTRVDGSIISVRLPRLEPALVVVITTAVSSFFSIFILGAHPTINAALVVCSIVLLLNLGVYLFVSKPIRSGEAYLIVDTNARTLVLPKTFGRKERVTLLFDQVREISVEVVQQQRKGVFSCAFAPALNSGLVSHRLAKWWEKKRSEAFVAWLRSILNGRSI